MQRRWVLPVVAAILALVTTLAIVQYLRGLRPQITVTQPIRNEAVVVARTDIAGRAVIGADQVEIRHIPFNAIHPRAVRRVEDVANRVALSPIYADQQVIDSMVAPIGVNVGLSYVLPKDKRALTIPVNEVVDVAGFVFPGDHVDVIGTVSEKDQNLSKIFLQDIPVIAVAQTVEQKPGQQPHVTTSATLALTPDQAEKLTQIDNNGKVRLALRPSGLTSEVETGAKTTEAAMGLHATPPVLVLASGPAPIHGFGLPIVMPPAPHTVELWRGTAKTTLSF
jgi:pilus assembly protein CpaB